MTPWPAPSLRHLGRFTDGVGVVEHARLAEPRRELGYCTDDAGRLLAVAACLPSDPEAHRLATAALRFLTWAHIGGGSFRIRMGPDRRWTTDPPSDDAAGRALLGLGTAVASAPWPHVRATAFELFGAASGFTSAHPRAQAYAALGAVEVLAAHPDHSGAANLVQRALDLVPACPGPAEWPWVAERLTYANALIPDAALAAATALRCRHRTRAALALLDWLVEEESLGGRFSFTPVGGRGPGEPRPGFDQQPIEAWAMADACSRAHRVTGETRWAAAAEAAGRWFLGDNDAGVPVFDPSTGGGFDGLEPRGVNRNQGAESSIAFVATMIRMRCLR